jgi:hypothetical protein
VFLAPLTPFGSTYMVPWPMELILTTFQLCGQPFCKGGELDNLFIKMIVNLLNE